MCKNICRYTKIIFQYFCNIFVYIVNWSKLLLCIIYTRNYVYLHRLIRLFSANQVSGPSFIISESRTFATAEKRSAVALTHGSGCGGECSEMRTSVLSLTSAYPWWGLLRLGRGKGVSRGACLPLTGILFTSCECCQWASDATRLAIAVSSFDQDSSPALFLKAALTRRRLTPFIAIYQSSRVRVARSNASAEETISRSARLMFS